MRRRKKGIGWAGRQYLIGSFVREVVGIADGDIRNSECVCVALYGRQGGSVGHSKHGIVTR